MDLKKAWNDLQAEERKPARIAIFIAVSVLLILAMLNTSGDNSFSGDYEARDFGSAGGAVSADSDAVFEDATGESEPTSPENPPPSETKAYEGREIITRGSATVKVDSPVQEAEAFSKWVEGQGGYIEALDSQVYESSTGERTSESTVTVRIEKLSEAMGHLKALPDSEVLAENVTRSDVTAQGKDLDARIAALRISITRLEKFLREATRYEDLFRVEGELTARQGQLDSLLAQRASLSNLVELQTLTVTFTSTERVANPSDEAGEGFKAGLLDGWNSLIAFLSSALYVFASVIPWLLILLPLLLLTFLGLGVRRRRHRKQSTAA